MTSSGADSTADSSAGNSDDADLRPQSEFEKEVEAVCLSLVAAGLAAFSAVAPDGTLSFELTPAGHRLAASLADSDLDSD